MLRVLQCLTARHSAHPSLASLRDLFDDVGRQLNLGLRDLALRNGLTTWQRENVEQTKRQDAPQFQLVFEGDAFKLKERVGNSSRLVGRRHVGPALRQQCLHGWAVGQGQPHRIIRTQWFCQQFCGQLGAGGVLVGGLPQSQLTAGKSASVLVGVSDGLVKINRRATRQRKNDGGASREFERAVHGAAFAAGIVFASAVGGDAASSLWACLAYSRQPPMRATVSLEAFQLLTGSSAQAW